jgi:hypothetical protein
MMKDIIMTYKKISLMLLAFASSMGIVATTYEFRSPLWFQRPHSHWPLAPVQESLWFTDFPDGREDISWQIESWVTVYHRSAKDAFWNPEKNDSTTKTASLSTLFFGREEFQLEEAFVNARVASAQTLMELNPAIGFAIITPVLEYQETGAVFGVTFDKTLGCEDQWHIGARLSVPFVVIDVDQDASLSSIEGINDLVRYRLLNLDEGPGADTYEFAYRADFLSSLSYPTVLDGVPTVIPVFRVDPDTGLVMLVEQRLSGDTSASPGVAAYAVKSSDHSLPPAPFRKTPAEASTPLPANGSGTDDQAYFFSTGTNYTNLLNDRVALSTLFIVPREEVTIDGEGAEVITAEANNLTLRGGTLSFILDQNFFQLGTEQIVEEFLLTQGVNIFTSERTVGIGDLEFEIYGGYGHRDWWFVDLIIGARFPTGKKDKNAKNIYFVSTGHNGHFELKGELEGGWMPCSWFAFKVDAGVHHAFNRTERRAAHFTGSTVNNIGPEVDAKVSWTYGIVHADLNFFHPTNPDIGVMLGYEFYARTKDHIEYKVTTAEDFAGQTGTLDATAAAARTNAMSHKLRGEFFHRWNYFELSLGLSHIVAGRSIPKETEAHLTFDVYF